MRIHKHNGMRFNSIDDIFSGIDNFYFEREYGLSIHSLSKPEYTRTMTSYQILFDLEGGVFNWFKNRDMVMKIEKDFTNLDVYFTYISDQIGSICRIDEFAMLSHEDVYSMFTTILDNGIYDGIFLSYPDVLRCLRSFNEVLDSHFKHVWKDSIRKNEIKRSIYLTTIARVKERIKKAFGIVV